MAEIHQLLQLIKFGADFQSKYVSYRKIMYGPVFVGMRTCRRKDCYPATGNLIRNLISSIKK